MVVVREARGNNRERDLTVDDILLFITVLSPSSLLQTSEMDQRVGGSAFGLSDWRSCSGSTVLNRV